MSHFHKAIICLFLTPDRIYTEAMWRSDSCICHQRGTLCKENLWVYIRNLPEVLSWIAASNFLNPRHQSPISCCHQQLYQRYLVLWPTSWLHLWFQPNLNIPVQYLTHFLLTMFCLNCWHFSFLHPTLSSTHE